MRNYIIIGTSIILALFIYFFDPYSDYLGVYSKEATLLLEQNETGYEWVVTKSNDNFTVDEINNNEWKIKINKKGESNIKAIFINLENSNIKYTINYKIKNNGKKIFWLDGQSTGLTGFSNLK